jgi:adenylate cyclase
VTHGGVVVDYAGDGILAMWNAPTPQPDHAARAAAAALDMLACMPGINDSWRGVTGINIRAGIGLNTGPALVGNTGSSRKLKYGPHGHTVNVAARVQDATKRLGLPLLVTSSTRKLLADAFALRRLGKVRLAGIECAADLFELHGTAATDEWKEQRRLYEQALEHFEKSQWAAALQELMRLPGWGAQNEHHDTPSLKLMKRAVSCLESRPETFEPVIE